MAILIPFGKYKGETLENLVSRDPGYLAWMAGEDISRNGINFSELAEALVEAMPEEEEPELCLWCGNTSCDGSDCREESRAASQRMTDRQNARVGARMRG